MFNHVMEMIKPQINDSFPKELTKILNRIYLEINNQIYLNNQSLVEKSSYIKEIETLIRSRFNLNVKFDKKLHVFYPAAILPFFSDYMKNLNGAHNFTVSDFINFFNYTDLLKHSNDLSKERDKLIKSLHDKKGYVDIKNARVGGYLSEVPHYIIVDFFTLIQLEITAEEMSAIIIHEIGHAFTGLESHFKLVKFSSMISDVMNEMNNKNIDKAKYIFKQNISQKDFNKLIIKDDESVTDFYNKIAIGSLGEVKSILMNSKYDETNFENLADSFCARMGVSQDLVTGLHKMHKRFGTVGNTNSLYYSTMLFAELLFAIMTISFFGIMGVMIVVFILTVLFNSDLKQMTYDFPIERYNRIKNNILISLKNQSLPNEFTKDLIAQYTFIDEIIQKSQNFKSIYEHISDYILPTNRANAYYIELQSTIENMLSNRLFLKSAQLSVS